MVLVASRSPDVVARCSQGLQGLCEILTVTDFGSLKQMQMYVKPQILFLDFQLPDFGWHNGIEALLRLHSDQKIIVLSNPLSDDMELGLFKAGVRGCCSRDIDALHFISIFTAVQQGELWIRRTLLLPLLDEIDIRSRAEEPPKPPVAGGSSN